MVIICLGVGHATRTARRVPLGERVRVVVIKAWRFIAAGAERVVLHEQCLERQAAMAEARTLHEPVPVDVEIAERPCGFDLYGQQVLERTRVGADIDAV